MTGRPILTQLRHGAEYAAIRGLIGALMCLPYERRVAACGWIVSRILAPLIGWRRRVRDNLARVLPDLPASEVRRLERAVPDNAGRAIIESLSVKDFRAHLEDTPLTGPGLDQLEAARAAGRPVVIVSGHFGNYAAARVVLANRYGPIGALYRPMKNLRFNEFYASRVIALAPPAYPTDRRGLIALIRHLKQGGMIAVLSDLYVTGSPVLTFFGQPAATAVSTAEWALKYDALMVPVFGIRQPDGLSFEIRVEEPIPHSDPETMTQAYNDRIEAMARAHPGQWFWIHRRWKMRGQRGRATA